MKMCKERHNDFNKYTDLNNYLCSCTGYHDNKIFTLYNIQGKWLKQFIYQLPGKGTSIFSNRTTRCILPKKCKLYISTKWAARGHSNYKYHYSTQLEGKHPPKHWSRNGNIYVACSKSIYVRVKRKILHL